MATSANTFEQLHRDLAVALVACRGDPSRRAVHALRSSTRRVEAVSRKGMEEYPRARPLGGNLEEVMDELRKVRRAAGWVRDVDVQRMLLVEFVEIAANARAVRSMGQRKELREVCAELDAVLQQGRKRFADRVRRTLKDLETRLERALDRISCEMEDLHGSSMLKAAGDVVLCSSLDLTERSSDGLQRYRKRIKAARYRAEMQGPSPVARRGIVRCNERSKRVDPCGRRKVPASGWLLRDRPRLGGTSLSGCQPDEVVDSSQERR